jgi:hypothetical protein
LLCLGNTHGCWFSSVCPVGVFHLQTSLTVQPLEVQCLKTQPGRSRGQHFTATEPSQCRQEAHCCSKSSSLARPLGGVCPPGLSWVTACWRKNWIVCGLHIASADLTVSSLQSPGPGKWMWKVSLNDGHSVNSWIFQRGFEFEGLIT